MKPLRKPTSRIAGATVIMVLLLAPGAFAVQQPPGITGLEVRPEAGEIELALTGSTEYGYFPLSDPNRLVFDFPGSAMLIDSGTTVTRDVQGACFNQIRLSQFSQDPLITRLVVYLTRPAEARVSYSSDEQRMIIRIVDKGGAESDNTVQPGTGEVIVTPEAGGVTVENPIRPSYEIVRTRSDLTIRFPGIDAGNITVDQSRFPDRIRIRMFTRGRADDTAVRFDQYERGNVWNDVAKQWASYIDRNSLGIIDLTIYLYPEVTYSQSLTTDGTPEVRLYKATLGQPVITPEPSRTETYQVEVDSYGTEPTSEPVGTDLLAASPVPETASGSIESAETTPPEPDSGVAASAGVTNLGPDVSAPASTTEETQSTVAETIPTTPEAPDAAETTQPEQTAIQAGATQVIPSVESVEVIQNGTLLAEKPPIEENQQPSNSPIETADRHPGGIPSVRMSTERDDLLSGNPARDPNTIYMRAGEVMVLSVDHLVRASVGNPAVATLNVISINELLITALAPGTTTLLTWEAGGVRSAKQINVLDATGAREEEIAALIADNSISVRIIMNGTAAGVVLEGSVQTEEERTRAGSIAALYAGAEKVTNLIEVTDPRQVMVKVRVVEIDKRALDERLSQFSAAARTNNDDFTIGIITNLLDPENPGGGLLDTRTRPGIVNGDAQDMVFDPIDAVLNALTSNREATVLSEPNVIAMSGHPAHFRVGGEVPYTYQNENGFNVVEFREFGIVLDMTPSVDSQGNIKMTVAPTVRTIDMALAIAGIPGFRTREMTTDVQLHSGETLVIGGLIQHEITEVVSEVPLLSEIPVLGQLFRSKKFNDDETELVIFLTPYVIENPAQAQEILNINPLETAPEE